MQFLMAGLIILTLTGCRTVSLPKSHESGETDREAATAVQSVVGAVSGQKVDEQQLRALVQEIKQDKDTQAAVQTVTDVMAGEHVVIKYCPTDGKRFSGHFELCPEHHVPLKIVEE